MSRPRKVSLFITCVVDQFYPQVGMSVVSVLERLGLREAMLGFEKTYVSAARWEEVQQRLPRGFPRRRQPQDSKMTAPRGLDEKSARGQARGGLHDSMPRCWARTVPLAARLDRSGVPESGA